MRYHRLGLLTTALVTVWSLGALASLATSGLPTTGAVVSFALVVVLVCLVAAFGNREGRGGRTPYW